MNGYSDVTEHLNRMRQHQDYCSAITRVIGDNKNFRFRRVANNVELVHTVSNRAVTYSGNIVTGKQIGRAHV